MKKNEQKTEIENDHPDPKWKDMYRVGFVACYSALLITAIAVAAYFIWPYKPGVDTVENIFIALNTHRFGGLVSLDLFAPIGNFVFLFVLLAEYAALKKVNESYALIALVLGLMGIVLWFVSKPLLEMVYLSEQYAMATSEAAKNQYLSAGEVLSALCSGTSWMLSQLFFAVTSVIYSLLMLRSNIFMRATAYIGIVNSILSLGMFIPIPILAVIFGITATLGGVVWFPFIAAGFYRLGWDRA